MMGCQYSESDGKCALYDSEIENPGWENNGYCICEEEDPSCLCEEYKSDEE